MGFFSRNPIGGFQPYGAQSSFVDGRFLDILSWGDLSAGRGVTAKSALGERERLQAVEVALAEAAEAADVKVCASCACALTNWAGDVGSS